MPLRGKRAKMLIVFKCYLWRKYTIAISAISLNFNVIIGYQRSCIRRIQKGSDVRWELQFSVIFQIVNSARILKNLDCSRMVGKTPAAGPTSILFSACNHKILFLLEIAKSLIGFIHSSQRPTFPLCSRVFLSRKWLHRIFLNFVYMKYNLYTWRRIVMVELFKST